MQMLVLRNLVALAALGLVLALGSVASADDLDKVDEALNRYRTLDYSYKLITTDAGGGKTVLKLRTRIRNVGDHNKQLIVIDEPADMKGTKVLTASPTQMYIFMPAFKKLRRIASHVNEQGFLGTALSSADMNLTRYGRFYQATVKSSDAKTVTLRLDGKDDKAPYPRIDMVVDKKLSLPVELKYYAAGGKHIKTERRQDYQCAKGYCVPKLMEMTDHTKAVTSVLKLEKHAIDVAVADDLFSKRSLH